MTPEQNSRVPEDWKVVARMDWQRVKRNLRDQDAVAAGFFLQQCLEKFLKAFLLSHNWKLRRIHRLDTLLDYAVNYDDSLEVYYELCERVSGYYFADRYPPLIPSELTCKDIEKDMQESEKFIKMMFPEEELKE
jgi:HEPN domain-containing protein